MSMTIDRRDFVSFSEHSEKRPRVSGENHWDTHDTIPEFAFILNRCPPAVDRIIVPKQTEPEIAPEFAFLIRQQKQVNAKELKSKDYSISKGPMLQSIQGVLPIPKASAPAPSSKAEKPNWIEEFENTFNEVRAHRLF